VHRTLGKHIPSCEEARNHGEDHDDDAVAHRLSQPKKVSADRDAQAGTRLEERNGRGLPAYARSLPCYIAPMERATRSTLFPAAALGAAAFLLGCETTRYEPTKATRSYPANLPQERVAEVQVFNDGDAMLIVNATVESWSNFDLWLNQRYMKRIDALAAGQTLRIPLGEFWDVRGEGPFPGGLLRYYPPTPIRLVQIQTAADAPLVGFLAIPTERELDAAQLKKDI
jgi:hypothetical protein